MRSSGGSAGARVVVRVGRAGGEGGAVVGGAGAVGSSMLMERGEGVGWVGEKALVRGVEAALGGGESAVERRRLERRVVRNAVRRVSDG